MQFCPWCQDRESKTIVH